MRSFKIVHDISIKPLSLPAALLALTVSLPLALILLLLMSGFGAVALPVCLDLKDVLHDVFALFLVYAIIVGLLSLAIARVNHTKQATVLLIAIAPGIIVVAFSLLGHTYC